MPLALGTSSEPHLQAESLILSLVCLPPLRGEEMGMGGVGPDPLPYLQAEMWLLSELQGKVNE